MAKRYYNYRSTSSGARQDPPDEGGGGGVPDWVPANAKIHIDLVGGTPQGRAWVNGTGEVTVDTLLGSDPNTDAIDGSSGYDTAQLVAQGYRFYDAPGGASGFVKPAFIGALRTAVLAGCTIRIEWYCPPASGSGDALEICSADGNNALEYYYTKTDDDVPPDRWFKAESWAGGYGTVTIDEIINKGTAGSANVFALTLTATRSEIAVNGSTVNAGVLASENWSGLVAAIVLLGQDDILASITLYDPLPDTTGLSELSQVAA